MDSNSTIKKILIITICLIPFIGFAQDHDQTFSIHQLSDLLDKHEAGEAILKFKIQKANKRFEIAPGQFDELGYRLIKLDRSTAAVAVFEFAVKIYPDSWQLWDSLGEAYMYAADKRKSVAAYNKSLEINAGNQNAKKKISFMDGYLAGIVRETRVAASHDMGVNTGIKKLYFGQEPPGLIPRVFAPGIVSTVGNTETAITFSPDGKEIVFTCNVGKTKVLLLSSVLEEEGWTMPTELPFSVDHLDFAAHITIDGSKLVFNRILKDENGATTGMSTLFSTLSPAGWTNPREFSCPGMFFSSTSDGILYTTIVGQGNGRYEPQNGGYSAVIMLNNSVRGGLHPCVARDGSYVVFDSDEMRGYGADDLYISFNNEDDTWTDPVNLGSEINGPGGQSMAMISPDNKYLLYFSNRDIYWVNIEYLNRFINAD